MGGAQGSKVGGDCAVEHWGSQLITPPSPLSWSGLGAAGGLGWGNGGVDGNLVLVTCGGRFPGLGESGVCVFV